METLQDPAPSVRLCMLAFATIVSLIAGACAGAASPSVPSPAPPHDGITIAVHAIRDRHSPSGAGRRWGSPRHRSCAGVVRREPASTPRDPPARLRVFRPGDRRLLPPGSGGGCTWVRLRLPRWDDRQRRQPVLERDRRLLQLRQGRRRRCGLPHGRHRRDPGEARHRPEADRLRRPLERRLHVVSDGLRSGRPRCGDREPGRRHLRGPGRLRAERARVGRPDPRHGRRRHSLRGWRGAGPITRAQRRRPRPGQRTTGVARHRRRSAPRSMSTRP